MRRRGRFRKSIALINPKNLAKEVHMYGYHFSWKAHVTWIVGAMVGGIMLGVLFQLKTTSFIVIAVAIGLTLPVLMLDMYKRMYEQKRFADVTSYMEQMLYSFLKTGKVVSAIKETCELYQQGQMRQCLDAAIIHMELGKPKSVNGVLREGLQMVEDAYPCEKLSMVHELLVTTEEYGGEIEESAMIMLEDIGRFKRRGYLLHAEKKKSHTDNVISVVVAVLLCALALYILDMLRKLFLAEGTNIFSVEVIQVSSTIFIVFLLGVFVRSTRNLTDDWLTEGMSQEDKYIAKSYDLVKRYERGECKWRKFEYRLAKRDVTEAMYAALPQWLIGLLLLLQNNNVQVALTKSIDTAPEVLQGELATLKEQIKKNPHKMQTYVTFCQGFDVPEISSCMKILHAFSENGSGNLSVQMNQLLSRVWQMQEKADEVKNSKIAFQMKMLFSYPVIAATAKLLLDLMVGMALMIQLLGSVGGI